LISSVTPISCGATSCEGALKSMPARVVIMRLF
jgi:hypothetical protein